MRKHQATPDLSASKRLSRSEALAPGYTAVRNAKGQVIAVHCYGLAMDSSRISENRAVRHFDR